jgi:hypothetical protein
VIQGGDHRRSPIQAKKKAEIASSKRMIFLICAGGEEKRLGIGYWSLESRKESVFSCDDNGQYPISNILIDV